MSLKTKNIDAKSPLRYQKIARTLSSGTSNQTGLVVGSWPFATKGKLVDLVIVQEAAGAGGTSLAVVPKKNGTGSSLTSTNGVVARADGVCAVDAKGDITKPTNATKPVITASTLFSKGDYLSVDVTHSGTYSGAATLTVIASFEPEV